MEPVLIGLLVAIPVVVVGFIYAWVYSMQWMASLLFDIQVGMDDMYMDGK